MNKLTHEENEFLRLLEEQYEKDRARDKNMIHIIIIWLIIAVLFTINIIVKSIINYPAWLYGIITLSILAIQFIAMKILTKRFNDKYEKHRKF
ncbi:MAG: hypothetical protein IJF92_00230 [Bacilli bacterium]|nr:hypothetical protein [Bacilli bacterium]MBQ3307586.1 hypothetical protein [Bacilli bacterium]